MTNPTNPPPPTFNTAPPFVHIPLEGVIREALRTNVFLPFGDGTAAGSTPGRETYLLLYDAFRALFDNDETLGAGKADLDEEGFVRASQIRLDFGGGQFMGAHVADQLYREGQSVRNTARTALFRALRDTNAAPSTAVPPVDTEDWQVVLSLDGTGAGGTTYTNAQAIDAVAKALRNGGNVSIIYDPVALTITLASTASSSGGTNIATGPGGTPQALATLEIDAGFDLFNQGNGVWRLNVNTSKDFNIPFHNSTSGTPLSQQRTSGGDGSHVTVAVRDSSADGAMAINTGTGSTNFAAVFSDDEVFLLGGGVTRRIAWRIYIPTLSTDTDRYLLQAGFMDGVDGVTDGAFAEYDHTLSGGNWRLGVRNNGVESFAASSIAVTAGAYHNLETVAFGDGSRIQLYVNGTLAGEVLSTAAGGLPTGPGRFTGYGCTIRKRAGTNNRGIEIDHCRIRRS